MGDGVVKQTLYLDLPGGRCVSDLGRCRKGSLRRRGFVVLGQLPHGSHPIRPTVAWGHYDDHAGLVLREGHLSDEDKALALAFWEVRQ